MATLSVSILIMIALLIPGSDLPRVHIGHWDKVIHFTLFACWALAFRFDYRKPSFSLWKILLIGILFAFITEWAQNAVEGRRFDRYDLIADIAGVAAGWVLSRPVIRVIDSVLNLKGRERQNLPQK